MADAHEPWIVCRPAGRAGIDLGAVAHVIDPLRIASAPFLQRLRTLDVQTYAHQAMPAWVFYDCTIVPGAMFGFARRGPDGLQPTTLLGVIPTASRQAELVTSLCAPSPELMRQTIAAGAAALGIDRMMVVTQRGAPELEAWSSFGPLTLQTAWTPAHDDPRTLTFTVPTDAPARARSSAPRALVCDTSDDALRAMQARIEAGEVVTL